MVKRIKVCPKCGSTNVRAQPHHKGRQESCVSCGYSSSQFPIATPGEIKHLKHEPKAVDRESIEAVRKRVEKHQKSYDETLLLATVIIAIIVALIFLARQFG